MDKEIKRKIGIVCSLMIYFIYVVLLMVRTKMLIISYGSEVNAVFQTSSQVFSYLTLFESGMSAAYQFRLYEPVSQKKIQEIIGLYVGLKKSMKKIALKMTVALIVVSMSYPFIMDRISLSVVKAGMILFLLGLRFVIPYIISIALKTILNVYDYKYVVDNVDSVGYVSITVIEIFAISEFCWSIYAVLLIGCVGNIVMGLVYLFLVRTLCSEIHSEKVTPNFEPEGMTKDILFHRITGLFNSNVDTIILSLFDIMLVTPYHAYCSITNYFSQVVNKISENYRTKIGMKIEKRDPDLYNYFQLMISFHMIAAIITVSMFVLNINCFVCLWIGREYMLSNTCVVLMGLYLVHRMTNNSIYLVRDGAGLYKESKWFSFWEGILNVILSMILVRYFGIEGVLFATVFAVYTILAPGNARLAYTKVMGRKNTLWADHLIIIITSALLVWGIGDGISAKANITWEEFVVKLAVQGSICTVAGILVVIIVKWKYISLLWKQRYCNV